MLGKSMLWFVTLELCVHLTETKTRYTEYKNSFILRRNGPAGEAITEEALEKLSENGYKLEKQIVQGHFQFVRDDTPTRSDRKKEIHIDELKQIDDMIVSFEQEVIFHRELRSAHQSRIQRSVNIADPYWSDQWYLDPSHTPSMRVYDAWEKGYTGQGITVAVVDNGIDITHVDLIDNYDASLSYDYIYNLADASHAYPEERHGTNCAGIIAATRNEHCVIGIAHEAKLTAIRLIDVMYGATASEEASALIHELDNVDIYSNSWGPTDDGDDFDETHTISSIQEAALLQGVTMGRNGKGAIYTWAAGNRGDYDDDCNVDGYSNNMYTITVTSLAPDTAAAQYAEQCTAILAATYGGDNTQDQIATTSPNDMCIDDFKGTSAACPVASGIIALLLQANQILTWRDVQHMIVEYSTNTGLKNANFYSNAAGKRVSLSHGFGLLNAEAMVDAAPAWQTVPRQVSCVGATLNANKTATGLTSVESTWMTDGCSIVYLEHVYIYISFRSKWRNQTSIYLVSPGGTESRILRQRISDTSTSSVTWKFLSVHTWGENPFGTWTLRMDSTAIDNELHLETWSLTFYGTVTDPLSAIPDVADGTQGGYCDDSVECVGLSVECVNDTCQQKDEKNTDRMDLKVAIAVGSIAGAAAITTGIVLIAKGLWLKRGVSLTPAVVGHRQGAWGVAEQAGKKMSTNLHAQQKTYLSRTINT